MIPFQEMPLSVSPWSCYRMMSTAGRRGQQQSGHPGQQQSGHRGQKFYVECLQVVAFTWCTYIYIHMYSRLLIILMYRVEQKSLWYGGHSDWHNSKFCRSESNFGGPKLFLQKYTEIFISFKYIHIQFLSAILFLYCDTFLIWEERALPSDR